MSDMKEEKNKDKNTSRLYYIQETSGDTVTVSLVGSVAIFGSFCPYIWITFIYVFIYICLVAYILAYLYFFSNFPVP